MKPPICSPTPARGKNVPLSQHVLYKIMYGTRSSPVTGVPCCHIADWIFSSPYILYMYDSASSEFRPTGFQYGNRLKSLSSIFLAGLIKNILYYPFMVSITIWYGKKSDRNNFLIFIPVSSVSIFDISYQTNHVWYSIFTSHWISLLFLAAFFSASFNSAQTFSYRSFAFAMALSTVGDLKSAPQSGQ